MGCAASLVPCGDLCLWGLVMAATTCKEVVVIESSAQCPWTRGHTQYRRVIGARLWNMHRQQPSAYDRMKARLAAERAAAESEVRPVTGWPPQSGGRPPRLTVPRHTDDDDDDAPFRGAPPPRTPHTPEGGGRRRRAAVAAPATAATGIRTASAGVGVLQSMVAVSRWMALWLRQGVTRQGAQTLWRYHSTLHLVTHDLARECAVREDAGPLGQSVARSNARAMAAVERCDPIAVLSDLRNRHGEILQRWSPDALADAIDAEAACFARFAGQHMTDKFADAVPTGTRAAVLAHLRVVRRLAHVVELLALIGDRMVFMPPADHAGVLGVTWSAELLLYAHGTSYYLHRLESALRESQVAIRTADRAAAAPHADVHHRDEEYATGPALFAADLVQALLAVPVVCVALFRLGRREALRDAARRETAGAAARYATDAMKFGTGSYGAMVGHATWQRFTPAEQGQWESATETLPMAPDGSVAMVVNDKPGFLIVRQNRGEFSAVPRHSNAMEHPVILTTTNTGNATVADRMPPLVHAALASPYVEWTVYPPEAGTDQLQAAAHREAAEMAARAAGERGAPAAAAEAQALLRGPVQFANRVAARVMDRYLLATVGTAGAFQWIYATMRARPWLMAMLECAVGVERAALRAPSVLLSATTDFATDVMGDGARQGLERMLQGIMQRASMRDLMEDVAPCVSFGGGGVALRVLQRLAELWSAYPIPMGIGAVAAAGVTSLVAARAGHRVFQILAHSWRTLTVNTLWSAAAVATSSALFASGATGVTAWALPAAVVLVPPVVAELQELCVQGWRPMRLAEGTEAMRRLAGLMWRGATQIIGAVGNAATLSLLFHEPRVGIPLRRVPELTPNIGGHVAIHADLETARVELGQTAAAAAAGPRLAAGTSEVLLRRERNRLDRLHVAAARRLRVMTGAMAKAVAGAMRADVRMEALPLHMAANGDAYPGVQQWRFWQGRVWGAGQSLADLVSHATTPAAVTAAVAACMHYYDLQDSETFALLLGFLALQMLSLARGTRWDILTSNSLVMTLRQLTLVLVSAFAALGTMPATPPPPPPNPFRRGARRP